MYQNLNENKQKMRIEKVYEDYYDDKINELRKGKLLEKSPIRIGEIEAKSSSLDIQDESKFIKELIKDLNNLPELWDSFEPSTLHHLQSLIFVNGVTYNKEKKTVIFGEIIPLLLSA